MRECKWTWTGVREGFAEEGKLALRSECGGGLLQPQKMACTKAAWQEAAWRTKGAHSNEMRGSRNTWVGLAALKDYGHCLQSPA